ncbi:MAG: hypothetical protein IJD04_02385 [Desulfovibrionaceae bacterium]|nr:hypothetical protein [Desulfovibrionaceae bacterium]
MNRKQYFDTDICHGLYEIDYLANLYCRPHGVKSYLKHLCSSSDCIEDLTPRELFELIENQGFRRSKRDDAH